MLRARLIETGSKKDSIFLINIPFVCTMHAKAVFFIIELLVIAKYFMVKSMKDELCVKAMYM